MYGPVNTCVVAVLGRAGRVVVLLRVLLRHRRRGRQRERPRDDRRTRTAELEDDRLIIRRRDAGDLLRLAVLVVLDALDVAHVGADVRTVDGLQEAALERVLDVRGRDLAVHRRAELHARRDLHGQRLAVVGDLRRAFSQVRLRVDRVVRLERVQRALRRVGDQEPVLVVRDARVDVVDIAGVHHRQVAALLGFLGPRVGRCSARASPSSSRRRRNRRRRVRARPQPRTWRASAQPVSSVQTLLCDWGRGLQPRMPSSCGGAYSTARPALPTLRTGW